MCNCRCARRFYGAVHLNGEHDQLGSAKLKRKLPSRAQVVICGGGVVGCSVAFHLPQLGYKDVIHLEQGR